jgi:trehalose-6-phosphate synthase
MVVALMVGVTVVSLVTARRDVNVRVAEIRRVEVERATREAARLVPDVARALEAHDTAAMRALLERAVGRGAAAGVIVFDAGSDRVTTSADVTPALVERTRDVVQAAEGRPYTEWVSTGDADLQISTHLVARDGGTLGTLALISDGSRVVHAPWTLWKSELVGVLWQVITIVALTVLLVRWSVLAPLTQMARWMSEQRANVAGAIGSKTPPTENLFQPLAQEVAHLVSSLEVARASAREEARLRDAAASRWTAERLRAHVQKALAGRSLFVISNREPYIHMRTNGTIETLVPASGLVTALEPILRACNGTWIAHGSGSADREVVDENDRIRVPAREPEYTLRRVWLTPDEEEGYYYGFSNEGLWPLCHIAHTRPLFRASDWAHYQVANRKFARATLDELQNATAPIVLIQDYHFALLPALLKAERPDAQIAVFWHIPWPNPEAFGICPWQADLLDGLLGADLIGFHTQAHCNNFLETVDRALESQVDWENFTVRRNGHVTSVKPFPISVARPEPLSFAESRLSQGAQREALLSSLGVSAHLLGVGVDRMDYTKGIVERFLGIERFLERWPEFVGQFTFAQLAAPSRSRIPRYREFELAVEAEANRINERFQTSTWRPILLRRRHHGHDEILKFYRAADLCLVTSLHDGMNLVAKEFVASRDDEDGVLILSRFAGASGELHDALVVNPYDTDELAAAIHQALTMSDVERTDRMGRMHHSVLENNVYRWAGTLISALARSSSRSDRTDSRNPRSDATSEIAVGK